MGNAQSRARWKLQTLFRRSSDYAHLPSSPSKQTLLKDGALDYYHLPEQYKTTIRGILMETTTNAKKVADLEYKIELLVSKNMAMEESIKKCSADMKKVSELGRTIEGLLSKSSLMEKNIEEINKTSMKNVSKIESKIKLLEKLQGLDNSVAETSKKEIIGHKNKVMDIHLDKEFDRIETLLLSETASNEGNVRKLRAKADGLVLMSSTQNNMHDLELDKDAEEPEYANRMMGLILMLIVVVFVLIGMQL